MRIHDSHFLRRAFREFAHRTLTDRGALAHFSIEVSRGRQAIDDIRIEIFDREGPRIILGMHWLRGATVLRAEAENRALWDVNDSDELQSRLTKLLFRFCKRHGVIDTKGRIALPDENRATA